MDTHIYHEWKSFHLARISESFRRSLHLQCFQDLWLEWPYAETQRPMCSAVSMTTERKLPPKTFNLNRRHMACEGPPGKKHKSINPLYTQTPLRWSFHNAQRASLGGTVKSYPLYTLHISSSSQTAILLQSIVGYLQQQIYVLSVRWAPPSGSWGWAAGRVCLPRIEGSGWSWAQRRWETTYPWSPSHPTLRGKQSGSLWERSESRMKWHS